MNATDFASLPISSDLKAVASELGFERLTPIQAASIPLLLQGKDLIGQSKTGSGKTVAFSLPILERVDLASREVQALILCPTRELCTQVAREIRRLARRHKGLQVLILSGGLPGKPQALALRRGAHIAVGTPGRVLDHINRGNLNVNWVSTLVLDEADRMLDMGFEEDMQIILEEVPGTRQTVFFSATYPPSIEALSKKYQHDPARVTIESEPEDAPLIEQVVVPVGPDRKPEALLRVLEFHRPDSVIVFCNLKATVAELAQSLISRGVSSSALHGDLEQIDRDRVMAKFRGGSTRVLVATDVAARGLDIDELQMVINYDLPHQSEDYVHRIGRTGRAGRKGLAISLASESDERRLQEIMDYTGLEIIERPLAEMRASDEARGRLPQAASMKTLYISGGRKDKVRPGDIMGALTGEAGGLQGSDVGKIEIHDRFSYVAVSANVATQAVRRLTLGRIKGRKFLVRLVD